MSRRTVGVQQTSTFDLPTKAGKCKDDYLIHILVEQPTTTTFTSPHRHSPSLIHTSVCVYTICGCLEQRGHRGRRLRMKRMKSSKAMMVTMETQPAWGRGGVSGASAGIMLVRFNMQPSVQPASLPFIWIEGKNYCHSNMQYRPVELGGVYTVLLMWGTHFYLYKY